MGWLSGGAKRPEHFHGAHEQRRFRDAATDALLVTESDLLASPVHTVSSEIVVSGVEPAVAHTPH